MKTLPMIAAACALCLTSAAPAIDAQPINVEALENAGFSGTLARWDDLYVASQPDEAGLARMAEAGVTMVINLRTPGEMEGLSYDEPAMVERLGMRYVHVPQGGSAHPATPEALAQVTQAIAEANGAPVLLHCASSGRASHMFAAWLNQERNVPMHEAIEQARAIGFGSLRVEQLLNTQFEMFLAEELSPEMQ